MEKIKGKEFDKVGFLEELRVASVADQRRVDARYISTELDGGPEFSDYPEASAACIDLVVKALRDYPEIISEIMDLVDGFLARCKGTSGMSSIPGLREHRPDDVWRLWRASEGGVKFWKTALAMALKPSDSGSEIDQAKAATAGAAKEAVRLADRELGRH